MAHVHYYVCEIHVASLWTVALLFSVIYSSGSYSTQSHQYRVSTMLVARLFTN